jgi:hypothetical protein
VLAAAAGSGTGLAVVFSDQAAAQERPRADISVPVFSGATRSVPQFSLEFYLLVGSLARTAGALFVLFGAM